ncbi:MAG: hypothetical protein JW787_02860 [Sedimentisphaerales bacterium]|nr:hypothetical protein [Sedimentisphaerales bacterium]
MKNIDNRLEKIEKKMNIGKESKVAEIIVHTPCPEGTEPPNINPYEYRNWITYKQKKADAEEISKKTGFTFLVFVTDQFMEYEAQHNMPEGVLSNHPLARTILFDDLLILATKRNEMQQNQEKKI